MLVYLFPQALAIAVPVGFTLGTLLGLRGRVVSRRSTGTVLACAILCSVACLAMVVWILPVANHEFRQLVFGQERLVSKGINELTLGELGQQIESDRRSGLPVGRLLFTYHMRFALSCATLVLALFALSVTRHLVARWTVALAAFGTCFGYYAMLWTARAAALQEDLPAFAAAWLPNVVFAVVSAVLLRVDAGPDKARPAAFC
jgi:lipopolysaccharide export LptBFGC system permease protein LptF